MPGFPGACPAYFDCSLDVWVTLAAALTYALIAEVALLMVSVLAARPLRLRGSAMPAALLVGVFALIAAVCVGWLSQTAPHTLIPFAHFTAARLAALRQSETVRITRSFLPIGIVAFAFVLGTSTTAISIIHRAIGARRAD